MQELAGHTLLGRYRVDAFLGQGGMAKVYKAWDSKRAAFVAIKLVNEDMAEDFVFVRRFAREAQALERLEHPHIVRFLGFEEAPGMAFMVMEYIEGLTLRRYLNLLGRPLVLSEVVGVLQPMCSALHYAHQMGVYHCDVKPANIFIERGGRVVMGDFGIAQLSESATVTFSTPGTPAYMSPEQCRGGEEIDGRTDIYSIGITTYEMLTLDRPFTGETGTATGSRGERVRWEQMHIPPPPPHGINPEIPLAVEKVVLRALEKDPLCRHQRVLEFFTELYQAAAVEPAKMLPEVVEERAEPIEPTMSLEKPKEPGDSTAIIAPRIRLGVGVVGIGLVVLVVLLFAWVGLPSPPSTTTPVPPVVVSPSPDALTVTVTDSLVEEENVVLVATTGVPPTDTPVPIPSNTYILYVLDASNSMMQSVGSQSKLAITQVSLSQHLQTLDPTINAGLLVFGHKINAVDSANSCGTGNVEFVSGMQTGFTASIGEKLPAITAIGKSPLAEAIKVSYQQFTFLPDRINGLIIIADGSDNCEENPLDPITRNQQVGQRMPIYVVGLDVESADREQLVRIAEETGGDYQDASGIDELVRRLNGFVEMIRQQ